jgi:phosphoserine phosphatase
LGSIYKKKEIDYVHANELEIIDGKLTGKYLGDIDGPKKAIKAIAEKKAYISTKLLPWVMVLMICLC